MHDEGDAADLQRLRQSINEADRQIAELFSQRMSAVAQVAAYKAARGLPVYDAERERVVVERNAALVPDEVRPYYLRFLEATMEVSRHYQLHLIQEMQGGQVAPSASSRAFDDLAPEA